MAEIQWLLVFLMLLHELMFPEQISKHTAQIEMLMINQDEC